MGEFSFEWLGIGSLEAALREPVSGASISMGRQGAAFTLKLWRKMGSALEIYSKMHDVGFREEVGVLGFTSTKELYTDEQFIDLPEEFLHISFVEKLTIPEAKVGSIESGVLLRLKSKHELIVVPGGFPCSLAITGLPGFSADFDPEYGMEEYIRSPM